MKNQFKIIRLSVIVLLLNACATTKPLKKEGILMEEGADLFYKVKAGNSTYNFDININEFTNVISFDWEMGSNSGTVAMKEDAINNATDLKNYFSDGYKLLKTKTSVWFSKKLFTDLKSGKTVAIGLDNGIKENFEKTGIETYSFGAKADKTPYNIPVLILKSKETDKVIWVADDKNNPLIVKMNLDFSIHLVAYKAFK